MRLTIDHWQLHFRGNTSSGDLCGSTQEVGNIGQRGLGVKGMVERQGGGKRTNKLVLGPLCMEVTLLSLQKMQPLDPWEVGRHLPWVHKSSVRGLWNWRRNAQGCRGATDLLAGGSFQSTGPAPCTCLLHAFVLIILK